MSRPARAASDQPAAALPGPYILRSLLENIQLSEDEVDRNVRITCVEFWDDNLYIGTSAGEILHYVLIPPEAGDSLAEPTFIQASRLQVRDEQIQHSPDVASAPGIQQILLVPATSRACILSDGSLSFYTLPELSPAYGGSKIPKVTWVGGLDQSISGDGMEQHAADVVMICVRNKIRLMRMAAKSKPERVTDIEIGRCWDTCRRGDIACVADSRSYSLLDVAQQQSIPLFEISSQQNAAPDDNTPPEADQSLQEAGNDGEQKEDTLSYPEKDRLADGSKDSKLAGPPLPFRPASGGAAAGHSRSTSTASAYGIALPPRLRPHIVSPTGTEFLLTTGTAGDEPGVGIFVNLDGDVVRGTLEFAKYPTAVVLEGDGVNPLEPVTSGDSTDEGYVFAVLPNSDPSGEHDAIELQRWDLEPGDPTAKKYLLLPPIQDIKDRNNGGYNSLGLRKAMSLKSVPITQISTCLKLVYTDLNNISDRKLDSSAPARKERERSEADFISRMSFVNGRILVWEQNSVWWAVRTPSVVMLDARLNSATSETRDAKLPFIDRHSVMSAVNDLRGKDPQTELDFVSHRYIRQKASLLLFIDLVDQALDDHKINEPSLRATEDALIEGEIDPRLVLAVVPMFWEEVRQSSEGTWIQGGLRDVVESFLARQELPGELELDDRFTTTVLPLLKRYLLFWRQRKGFGSVSDEKEVFNSVDAALLRLLLFTDQLSPKGPGKTSTRTELYSMVDSGVDCFEYAVSLLERNKRLYVLSRLYQSRKLSYDVLATWKRIIEGEVDAGGELVDGEERVRRYLIDRNDAVLVEEFGTWLANRNPAIGVRVFAEANSKIKYDPKDALKILKARAPSAVRFFLEHLVFEKNLAQYANDLIGYFLDTVLEELKTSKRAKQSLHESYTAYRALQPPKPTYVQFATDNALDADWWRARLRLLQLLGGSHGAASQYDVPAILHRIEPYRNELVPESIILGGKQGHHKEAVHLLVHSLADYDTATMYCFLGGSSTYSPSLGPRMAESLPSHDEQKALFQHLLREFMSLEDKEVRIRQATELLDRFSGWFDIEKVLTIIPDSWPVDAVSSFIERALRQLLSERHETAITVALTSCQNLNVASQLAEKMSSARPRVDTG